MWTRLETQMLRVLPGRYPLIMFTQLGPFAQRLREDGQLVQQHPMKLAVATHFDMSRSMTPVLFSLRATMTIEAERP